MNDTPWNPPRAGTGDGPVQEQEPTLPFGVNVIGYISGALGLGVAARLTVQALLDNGVPVALIDVNLGERSLHDLRFQHLHIKQQSSSLPHRCSIFHLNTREAAAFRASYPGWFVDSFNVVVPFWELDQPPADWLPMLDQFDLVLASSHFLAATLAGKCSAPVRHYPLGVALEPYTDAATVRTQIAIPQDAFVVYSNFDGDSGINRKNPEGNLRAFLAAFGQSSKAHLILKINSDKEPPAPQTALLSRARSMPNITVIDHRLPYAAVLGLVNAADAYLSLHRAEGLGLGVLEAMTLGKPVVTTGWSGVMDFVDESNALPVRFVRTPVVDAHREYQAMRTREPAMWAEPDVEHASRMLRLLAEDPALRRKLGERARETAADRNRRFFAGDAFRPLRAAFEIWQRERAP
ncbi:MAG: glycosyltransferase family 4 protein [Nevskia sp.]|nr:glycosyltransferase family 4 protein [Nevskia sp.]